MRRSLSGIYLFEKFENEEKRTPTCFEDCSIEKQEEFLNSLNMEQLKNLAKQLAETIKELGDKFDLIRGSEKDES